VNHGAFLEALYDGVEGFVEVRALVDRKTGEERKKNDVRFRKWFRPNVLAERVPKISEWCKERRCAFFYGVLPRRVEGKGKAADIADGRVVWADMDFDHYPGGEGEARKRVDGIQLAPSILVRSGHGLHAYWLLGDLAEPPTLSSYTRRLGQLLDADPVHNPDRLLRVPGSFNLKNPEVPKLVEIEHLEDKRYRLPELDEILPESRTAAELVLEAGEFSVPKNLPDRIAELLGSRKVRDLYLGRGKRPGTDQSASGYDASLAVVLLQKGCDEETVAGALYHRPGSKAAGLPPDQVESYIYRTVSRAQQWIKQKSPEERGSARCDLEVTKLVIYQQDPPTYRIHAGGRTFYTTAAVLASPVRLRQRCLEALNRIPRLPERGHYDRWLNALLEKAEIIEQPAEASEDGAIAEELDYLLNAMPRGESAADLARSWIPHGGKKAIRLQTLCNRIHTAFPRVPRTEIARHLRDKGWSPKVIRISGDIARVWVGSRVDPEPAEDDE
jgi:hypothetical protein